MTKKSLCKIQRSIAYVFGHFPLFEDCQSRAEPVGNARKKPWRPKQFTRACLDVETGLEHARYIDEVAVTARPKHLDLLLKVRTDAVKAQKLHIFIVFILMVGDDVDDDNDDDEC